MIGFQHLDRAPEVVAVELVALFEQQDHLLEEPRDAVGIGWVAGDGDLVAAHEDVDGERALHEAEQLVALAEQADHEVVARDEDLDRDGRVRRCQGARECRRAANHAVSGARPARRRPQLGETARRPSCSSRVPSSSRLRPMQDASTRRSERRIVSRRPLKS